MGSICMHARTINYTSGLYDYFYMVDITIAATTTLDKLQQHTQANVSAPNNCI